MLTCHSGKSTGLTNNINGSLFYLSKSVSAQNQGPDAGTQWTTVHLLVKWFIEQIAYSCTKNGQITNAFIPYLAISGRAFHRYKINWPHLMNQLLTLLLWFVH